MVKNMLHRKLIRDMRHNAMQFFALASLCVLGIFLFSGIDSIALITQRTNQAYFEQNKLADFWVTLPQADRDALGKIRAIDGVSDAEARFSVDMQTDLPNDAVLAITAYSGEIGINVPVVLEGEMLATQDLRGCLLQQGFANAQGIRVGDGLTVRYGELEYVLYVRGIINSPEYVSVSGAMGMSADMSKYGYAIANAASFEQIPLTQVVVLLEDGANEPAVRVGIEQALPSAFIVDRASHQSTVTVRGNAQMFRNLSIMFPLAAYAVAALIVMTTLTRMIDNQRQQIGTLRALGFSGRQIKRHYLLYAIVPSVLGSVIGVFLGHYGLPAFAWDMLVGQSEYPFLVKPAISLQSWLMAALTVVMSWYICLSAYKKTTKESAASLLRPKTPKDGKRMLLERVGFIWKRLDFNAKMVVRNLMRNKLRTIMSCVGLLCCNTLLIASMGLQDSVTDTISKHYTGTLSYTHVTALNGQVGDASAYERHIDAEVTECAMESSLRITFGMHQKATALTVLGDNQQLLRLGENGTYVALQNGTAALTQKLATELGTTVGSVLSCQLPGDDQPFTIAVGQIVQNNLSQGVYLTRTTWQNLRKGAFTPTVLYLKNPSAAALRSIESMQETGVVEETGKQAQDALMYLNNISTIFMVLMIIALALAFVICYNMGLINFAERTREYATLKVLGYHQREIRRLIIRENTLIATLAIALSIVPGIGFTNVILRLAEADALRYVVHVSLRSVVLSCVITFLFSAFIQRLLARKVRSIVMVEALKSVE